MAEEKTGILKKTYSIVENILSDHHSPNDKGLKTNARKTLRIVIGSIKKFLDDEGLLRSAAISYSLVVSFVPIMVVILLVGAKIIEKEKYFMYAREFIRKHGIPIDPDPYFNVIMELLNNASTVTGIGFIVLLFSATSVLREMETAMNRIWNVKKGRPWIQKISGFLLVLIFGPILLTLGISTGQSLVNQAAPPAIISVENIHGSLVATGEKSTLLRLTKGKWVPENILSKIDFETQKETVLINSDRNTIISGDEKEALLPKIYHPQKKEIIWKTFQSYAANKDNEFIVTDNGCILTSVSLGQTWSIQCYEREDTRLLFKVKFNKIQFFDDQTGYIIGDDGIILRTENGGLSWTPSYIGNLRVDLTGILKISKENFIIIGKNFTAFKTEDGGGTWKPANDIMQLIGKDKPNLSSIRKFNHSIWITGDYGTLLFSPDNGKTWGRNNLGIAREEFSDILFLNEEKGILIGEQGFIRFTEDSGSTWRQPPFATNVNLYEITQSVEDGKIYITGDKYIILGNSDKSRFTMNVMQKSPFATSVLSAFGSMILPFIVIGIIFFLLYKILPYTDVLSKAAFYGACVTSLLWVLFLFVFKYYVAQFSKGTFAIYGTLAAIPLMLLLVYTSICIMIYGSEIAFFVQNPGLLKLSGLTLKISNEKRQMWYGLKILYTLYNNFEKGKGSTKESELVKICQNDYAEFYGILNKFMERNIIEKTAKKTYTPIVSASMLQMKEIMDDIDPTDYHVPEGDSDENFRSRVADYFGHVKEARSEVFRNLTFEQIFSGKK
ncbi:MAG: YihY/virulence factor BrkB family protein [Spirochaetia bacterium]|nr:YihY/virulence factor BrkB family protein [Spirochaetia bacterium]